MNSSLREVLNSFLHRKSHPETALNTSTDGRKLFLHGNCIAMHRDASGWDPAIRISAWGWPSATTARRLTQLLRVMGANSARVCRVKKNKLAPWSQKKNAKLVLDDGWGEKHELPFIMRCDHMLDMIHQND